MNEWMSDVERQWSRKKADFFAVEIGTWTTSDRNSMAGYYEHASKSVSRNLNISFHKSTRTTETFYNRPRVSLNFYDPARARERARVVYRIAGPKIQRKQEKQVENGNIRAPNISEASRLSATHPTSSLTKTKFHSWFSGRFFFFLCFVVFSH